MGAKISGSELPAGGGFRRRLATKRGAFAHACRFERTGCATVIGLELRAHFTLRLQQRDGKVVVLGKELKTQEQFESGPEGLPGLLREKLRP